MMKQKLLPQFISSALRMPQKHTALWLGSLAALALHAPVYAQEAPPERIEEVVVTGTPGGAEMRKLDASFAVTNIDEEAIKRRAPSSTADLLKSVPGVWVESSGGKSGANIFVRGFPSGGDAPFVTVSMNGMPVFPPPTLSFLENSTMFRTDVTIARMEGLRGGPNPVFSNGQVGLTTNFILKEGGEQSEGVFKYSTSDFGLQRVDAMSSGKLADDLYYMVGGYTSSSRNPRDGNFNTEDGQQFTVNLTKILDNGELNVYHRKTDDHGTWFLPVSLRDTEGNSTGLDGNFTFVGPANRNVLVPFATPDGQGGSTNSVETRDMGQGRGWDGSITGGSITLDLPDNWTFTDRFSYTSGDANTAGFVPDGSAARLGTLTDEQGAQNVSGDSVGADALVQKFGAWVVNKQVESFSNDLSFAKQWDTTKVTLGLYTSAWDVSEQWSIGNSKWFELRSDGQLLDPDSLPMDDNPDELACQSFDQASCGFTFNVDAVGEAQENAFYAAVEQRVNDLKFDAGVRAVNRATQYSADVGALDGINDVIVDSDETEFTYTAALNYDLTRDSGVFARINDGVKFPDFDTYRDFFGDFEDGSDLIIDVQQFELGYKLDQNAYSLYATGFYNETQGQPFGSQGAGDFEREETEAIGVELDGNLYLGNFDLNLNATIQDAELTTGANKGNSVARQPDLQVRLTPSYQIDFSSTVNASIFGTLSLVDERFSGNANVVTLDSYEAVDLGVIVNVDDVEFQLAINNLTDEAALTEGDPRSGTGTNGRFILPRHATFSVAYNF
ncbi:TonB-dependent receptor [Marinimicrobium sp. C2-29]|uniref:TonB-dependent receptor n=1 Tax=Marinimicrobium sp. C2-29 TaxID=3139825 RepID=UPI003139FCFA